MSEREPPSSPEKRALAVRDLHPEVMRLFDRYVHGQLDRRGFLDAAGKFAALVGMTAAGVLDALNPRFVEAQQVQPEDARIRGQSVEITSPDGNGKARAYVVTPAKHDGKLPVVLVVHENRGLNPHIEDVARRVALAGFIAVAPDALFTLGGYPGDEDKARELFTKLDQDKTREDFVALANYATALPTSNGKLAVIGFCYGGGISNFLATRLPELRAAVPYYGAAPALEQVPKIKAELLLHFAANDERINAGWPDYEAALKKSKVKYEAFQYPGTQHGFANNTTPRFDQAAAQLSWQRTLALLERALRGHDKGRGGHAQRR